MCSYLPQSILLYQGYNKMTASLTPLKNKDINTECTNLNKSTKYKVVKNTLQLFDCKNGFSEAIFFKKILCFLRF